MRPPRRTIVLSANSDWNIVNFRSGLIRGLKGAGYEPVIIAPEDPLVGGRMRELGVARFPIRIDRSGLNPLADFKLLCRYRQLLREIRPAAFLGFTIKPNIYGSLAAASLDIPAIPNVSGLGTAFIRADLIQKIVTHLYRTGFRQAAAVLFQNREDMALFLERRLVKDGQAQLLAGSGVDLKHFSPVPLAGGPPIFLFVGRLLRDKGVVEFVQAARLLRQTVPKARFQLLGPIDEGNRTAIERSELDRWVSEGIIEYLGTSDDVRPFLAAASALVLPSYREGLPRSLLEASAMERPLIASDVAGCRDVVDDCQNGFLCKVRDCGSLAFAMERFARLNAQEQTELGKAARRKVQNRFSEDLVVDSYLELLGRVAPHSPGL